MKQKILALLLALAMGISLASCGGNNAASGGTSANSGAETEDSASAAGEQDAQDTQDAAETEDSEAEVISDLQYVQDKGTLIVGITEFAPLDYQDASGSWIGFDADMARAFAESLGVEAEFQIIEWDNKVFELNGKTIDVVWNGMTLTDEVRSSMECSNPYLQNAQVVVVPVRNAADYQTLESVQGLAFAVESGSAGKEEAEANGFTYTEVLDQANALLEVSTGTADAAIIDYLMALAMTGGGTSYDDLTFTLSLNTEEYGVGFRQGSDLAAALNDFFQTSYVDGTMQEIAETYEIAGAVIEQES